jgi:hypothetical protein
MKRHLLLRAVLLIECAVACSKQKPPDPPPQHSPRENPDATKQAPEAQPLEAAPATTPAAPQPKDSPIPSGAGADTAKAPYPVKWSTALELASLDTLDDKLREDTGFGVLEYGGQQIQPKSCIEWAELHRKGAEPPTSLAEADDGTAKERCGSLELLKRARGSMSTFVRALPWNRSLLGRLPVEIATAWSPEDAREVESASAEGLTFQQFDPKATARRAREQQSLEITARRTNSRIYLYPMVWADLNSDGIEDLVLSVRNADAEGPMTQMRLLVATRSTASAPLRVLEWR